MAKFEDMTSDELQAYLLKKCQSDPGIPVAHNGPLIAIKSIDTRYLPLQLSILIDSITRCSAFPVDLRTTEEKANKRLGISTCGAMRSWHNNDFQWLPDVKVVAADLSGKQHSYYQHVSTNCGTPNNQKIKFGASDAAAYVEYTGGGWREGHSKGRLVYDYVNDRIFLTVTHYQKNPEAGNNPFFLVTNPHHTGSLSTI